MATNLSWTSQLGEDYHNQPSEVMTAIQTLRAKAKEAGNLKTTPQVTVVQQAPQVIVIQPTNPQVVYVPVYNPAIVYGYPYVVPAYVYASSATTSVVVAGVIGFGVGIAAGAMMASSWGYSTWDCHWYGGGGGRTTTAERTTGTARGTGDTTVRARRPMDRTAALTPQPVTTRPQERTLAARPTRTRMDLKKLARPTTRTPEPTARRTKVPTRIEWGKLDGFEERHDG